MGPDYVWKTMGLIHNELRIEFRLRLRSSSAKIEKLTKIRLEQRDQLQTRRKVWKLRL